MTWWSSHLDASTAEIEGLGGRWLEPGNTRELEGFRWRCMADPEGNEFDIDTLPGRLTSPQGNWLTPGPPGQPAHQPAVLDHVACP